MLNQSQKLLVSTEYTDKTSIIYLGFKNLNFNLVLPVFIIDSPLPFIVGTICFGLSYLYRKSKPKLK
jgi:hypothetical protein